MAGSKASSFWGGQVVKDGFFCETGHHGHIGGLEGISGHDFRHVFIENVLQRSFSMNQIANVQFILWADFLPIWAPDISDLNCYLAPEAPAMLDSGIEWKIHFRGKTVETLIFNIFCMSWLRDGYPTILKPAWSQGKSFETSALWPGNVCQACPFAVKVGWAAAEALSKKKHSKLEVQKIHYCFRKKIYATSILLYHLSPLILSFRIRPAILPEISWPRREANDKEHKFVASLLSHRPCFFWGTVIIRW